MELDQEEFALIYLHRAKKEKERQQRAMVVEILKTALAYEEWLQENKYGSTYSTFCENFGFEFPANSYLDRPAFFKRVEEIRKSAYQFTQ